MTSYFKKELLSTGMMTGLMVIGMQAYHIIMANGISNNFILEFISKYPLTFLVATILNLILIGPTVKLVFFKLIFKPSWQRKNFKMNLTISTMIVLGMVTSMSIFGIIRTSGISNISLISYIHVWLLNLLVALPLQLIIVGPICRFLLNKIMAILNE